MLLVALAMADLMSRAVPPATPPVTPTPSGAAAASPMPQAAAPPMSAAAPAPDAAAVASPSPATPGPDTGTAASDAPTPPGSTTPAAATAMAATDMASSGGTGEPRDPWVKVNRAIFAVDMTLERGLLAPVAHGYVHVVPHVVRYHVTNALFNVEEPLTAINDLLQLRIRAMSKTVFRFVVNSTIGVAGLFDVAKSAGVPIHFSLFGQTLGRYGVKPGPYVMLPILGPSSVRDSIGRVLDGFLDPVQLVVGGLTTPDGLSLFVLEGVDWRSRSDETLKAVYSATDPYAFVRSAYTQSRAAAVSEATGKAVALPDFDAAPGTP